MQGSLTRTRRLNSAPEFDALAKARYLPSISIRLFPDDIQIRTEISHHADPVAVITADKLVVEANSRFKQISMAFITLHTVRQAIKLIDRAKNESPGVQGNWQDMLDQSSEAFDQKNLRARLDGVAGIRFKSRQGQEIIPLAGCGQSLKKTVHRDAAIRRHALPMDFVSRMAGNR